jgi:acetyl-CoA acetyltransferase
LLLFVYTITYISYIGVFLFRRDTNFMQKLKGRCAIAGIGETKVGKIPDLSAMALNLEASRKAIEDAGLRNKDIDGVLSLKPFLDPTLSYSLMIAENLGISPRYTTDLDVCGATPVAMVIHAIMAIATGLCTTVLCTSGRKRATGNLVPKHGRLNWGSEDFEYPFGLIGSPGAFALAARRHMHEYGTTSRQFGAVAVAMRKHACLNPNAQMHTPITIEDHQNSRYVAEPFRLLDCSLVSDGGSAVVVTSAERGSDLRKPPIHILGFSQFHPCRTLCGHTMLTTTPAVQVGKEAFGMAGLSPQDVDIAELYDCFTYTVIAQIEDFNFCRKGEGGAFVEGGRIEIGGELPVNTHGGLLSQAHLGGMLHITEAVSQLRREAGARQVAGAETALVSGLGVAQTPFATFAALILSKNRN